MADSAAGTPRVTPEFEVVAVSATATYALRQAILRPHQRLDEVAMAGDDDERATHLCAVGPDGDTLGVASLLFEPAPWNRDPAWRLRGMATSERARHRGVGSALLGALIDRIAIDGGGTLWCAARLSAEGFYRHFGFVRIGEEWEEPAIGRHVAMWRTVPPSTTSPR